MKNTGATAPTIQELVQDLQTSWPTLLTAVGSLALNPPQSYNDARAAKTHLQRILAEAEHVLTFASELVLRTRTPSILELARDALSELRSGNVVSAIDLRGFITQSKGYAKATTTKAVVAKFDNEHAQLLVADAEHAAKTGDKEKVMRLLEEALAMSEQIEETSTYLTLKGLLAAEVNAHEKLTAVTEAIAQGCWDDAVELLRTATIILNGTVHALLQNVRAKLASTRSDLLDELNALARAAYDAQNLAGAQRYHGLMVEVDEDNPLTLTLGEDLTVAAKPAEDLEPADA